METSKFLPKLNLLQLLQKLNHIYLVSALMLLGLLLRLPSLSLGLWRDEGSTYFDVLPSDLGKLIETVIYSELNPPGFYLIMHQWMQWFGSQEVVFKLPAFFFGLLLIPATYGLGRVVISRGAGAIAAAIATFAPDTIYYSQEARPYTLTALLCCLVVIFYCKALVSKHQIWYLAGFVFCTDLLLYVQYTGLLLVVSLGIITLYLLLSRVENFKFVPFAIAFGIIFLLFTPWLQAFLTHLHTGTPWNVKEPWFMRPKLFLGNIMSTIPLMSGIGKKAGLLLILLGMGVEAKQLLFPARKPCSRWMTPPNVSKITLVMCFILTAAMLSVLSYVGRYMSPFAPFAWVLFGNWLIALFQYIDRCWTTQRSRFSQQLAVLLLMLLLILPNSIYALSLGNGNKSGIRSLAANFQGNSEEKTFYLIAPDKFGPTFGYYFAQHPVKFYGFARWHRPEIFSPQGYAELWDSPTLISDMEQRIQDKIQQGYRRLALIQESATVPADIGPLRSTSRANKFLSRLRQTYTLLEKTDYPGIKESVTLYLFSIVKQN
jgi:Dolichyl-phosphate-mannose-protein mannosyltransferase